MDYINPPAKLIKHVDRLAHLQAGLKPPPINVEIDLTNRCNLGCEWCHFGHVHSRGPLAKRRTHDTGDVMDIGLIMRVLAQLKDFGVRSVTWTGGGEPSMHPLFPSIIRDCPLPQGIYTNGLRCGWDQETAALLKERCEWVYVSLDRHTKEGYKALKQIDGFEHATNGIKNLVEAEGKATIGVGFLLDAQSYKEFGPMATFAQYLKADYFQLRPAVLFDADNPGVNPSDTSWVREFLDRYNGCSIRSWPDAIVDTSRFRMYQNWQGHGYKTCHWTRMQSVITPDGRVWRCINRRGFTDPGDCLGDLNSEPFSAIWKRSGPFEVNEKCRVLCRGHIPNLTLQGIMEERKGHDDFI